MYFVELLEPNKEYITTVIVNIVKKNSSISFLVHDEVHGTFETQQSICRQTK